MLLIIFNHISQSCSACSFSLMRLSPMYFLLVAQNENPRKVFS